MREKSDGSFFNVGDWAFSNNNAWYLYLETAMTINTKRLETDAAYWDEVAPEGCDLYLPSSGFSNGFFLKSSDGLGSHKAIPRPTKPVSPEGVDGLPCVGSVVAPDWSNFRYRVEWAGGDRQVLISEIGLPDKLKITTLDRLRPIRTSEQRQREELLRAIAKSMEDQLSDGLMFGVKYGPIADAVIKFYEEHYNLEPKP